MNEIEPNNYQGEKNTSTNKMLSKLLIFYIYKWQVV